MKKSKETDTGCPFFKNILFTLFYQGRVRVMVGLGLGFSEKNVRILTLKSELKKKKSHVALILFHRVEPF